jgi:hypothetical protein
VDEGGRRINRVGFLAPLIGIAGSLALLNDARAGSARDYLNPPVDTWLAIYNASYTGAVTPEDGTDTVPGTRSNVFAQSLVLTRIMDYWGRTGGVSIVLPYAFLDTSAGPFPRVRERRVGYRLSVADEHIRRTRADPRAVSVVHSADVLELSFAGNDAARHLQSDLADQPKRKPLDGLSDGQFQLYAGRGLDVG